MVGDVMKKYKLINIISILLISFCILLNFYNKAYALDVISNPDSLHLQELGSENLLVEKVGIILGAINVVGVVISVITLMIIGMRYMLGSVEEKAEYKKTMGTYVLGVFLVVSITTLPNILYNIASNIQDM